MDFRKASPFFLDEVIGFFLQIISLSFNYFVILFDCTKGIHCSLQQDPTENKDSYGESNLPCPRCLRTPPNQGQRKRPGRADCNDNEGFPEIPWHLFFCKAWGGGGIQKLTAVFTLYRGVLNIFSAERTLFHYHLTW